MKKARKSISAFSRLLLIIIITGLIAAVGMLPIFHATSRYLLIISSILIGMILTSLHLNNIALSSTSTNIDDNSATTVLISFIIFGAGYITAHIFISDKIFPIDQAAISAELIMSLVLMIISAAFHFNDDDMQSRTSISKINLNLLIDAPDHYLKEILPKIKQN